jgi:hypothetical protein
MRSIDIWKKRANFSGTGSRGSLAEFKANYVNTFIKRYQIQSVLDFGCGDLYNSCMIEVEDYLGIDIVDHKHPKKIMSKNFKTIVSKFDEFESEHSFDLCLCMDVLYHLLEDEIIYLEKTISNIIKYSKKYIIIYAQDSYDLTLDYRGHLFNSPWRQILEKEDVMLIEEQSECQAGSSARFFIYEKTQGENKP